VSPNVNGGKEIRGAGWIETTVRPVKPFEWVQVFVPGVALLLVVNVLVKVFDIVLRTMRIR
jgi:lysocardiolipin and lysophospholipid acyltransferase